MPREQVPGGQPVPVLSSIPGIWARRGHLRRCCRVQRQQRVWFCCSDVGQAPPPTPAAPPPEEGCLRVGGVHFLPSGPWGSLPGSPTEPPPGELWEGRCWGGPALNQAQQVPAVPRALSRAVSGQVSPLCVIVCLLQRQLLGPAATPPGAAPRHTPYSRLHGAVLPWFPHQNTSLQVLFPASPPPEHIPGCNETSVKSREA